MDFYPSITKDLLLISINHPGNFIVITDEQLEIILNCRKSTIHYKNSIWTKSTTENFDIPMGAYNSVQIADLVGDIYIKYFDQDYQTYANRLITRWWPHFYTRE